MQLNAGHYAVTPSSQALTKPAQELPANTNTTLDQGTLDLAEGGVRDHTNPDSLILSDSGPVKKAHSGPGLKEYLKKTLTMALIVSSVATSMPGLAIAGDNHGAVEPQGTPVAEQVAEVAQSAETEWYQAPLELFTSMKEARYEGQVGDYNLRVDGVNTRARLRPKVRLDEAGLKAAGRIDIADTTLSKSEDVGGWNITQGAFGRVRLEGEIGGSIDSEGRSSDFNDHGILLQGGVFKRWETSVSDSVTFRAQTELGAQHNFASGDSTVYAGASQELRGESEFAGHDYHWTVQSKQRVSYSSTREDSTIAQMEVFAGVGKTFPARFFGRDANIRAEVGPRVQADSLGTFKVAPAARVGVRF